MKDKNIEFKKTEKDDFEKLVGIRIRAMKESLIAIGRFDKNRARARFEKKFTPENTYKNI